MNKENKYFKILLTLIILVLILILVNLVINGFKTTDVKSKIHNVTLEIEKYGIVEFELYEDKAPNTVRNFLALVNSGYYNDKVIYGKDINTIHVGRSIDGIYIPPKKSIVDSKIKKDSEKDTDYSIKGEFSENGVSNDLKHTKYMLSMSRANYMQILPNLNKESYNSAGGLFNIVMGERAEDLDGKYAVFGKVIKGQEVFDQIFAKETNVKEDEENKLQLRRFYPYIKIKNAKTESKETKKVEYQDMFDLNKYIIDKVNLNNNKTGQ